MLEKLVVQWKGDFVWCRMVKKTGQNGCIIQNGHGGSIRGRGSTLHHQRMICQGKMRQSISNSIVRPKNVMKGRRKFLQKEMPAKNMLRSEADKGEVTMISMNMDLSTKEHHTKFTKSSNDGQKLFYHDQSTQSKEQGCVSGEAKYPGRRSRLQ